MSQKLIFYTFLLVQKPHLEASSSTKDGKLTASGRAEQRLRMSIKGVDGII